MPGIGTQPKKVTQRAHRVLCAATHSPPLADCRERDHRGKTYDKWAGVEEGLIKRGQQSIQLH
jgi:hypothetical protein